MPDMPARGPSLGCADRLGGAARGSTMDGIYARLDSQERSLISNGYLRWLTGALRSAWSAAVATTIFAFALVVLQVGLIALAMGLSVFMQSFGPTF